MAVLFVCHTYVKETRIQETHSKLGTDLGEVCLTKLFSSILSVAVSQTARDVILAEKQHDLGSHRKTCWGVGYKVAALSGESWLVARLTCLTADLWQTVAAQHGSLEVPQSHRGQLHDPESRDSKQRGMQLCFLPIRQLTVTVIEKLPAMRYGACLVLGHLRARKMLVSWRELG